MSATLIRITFNDGTVKEFRHEGRGGGSWTKTLTLDEGWATVRDEYGATYSWPLPSIKEVETRE